VHVSREEFENLILEGEIKTDKEIREYKRDVKMGKRGG